MLSQSLEYFMHCIICSLREKGRKTSVVQADSKTTFHAIMSSFSLAMSQARPVNTLFQIRLKTNCVKKLAIQKHQHMWLQLCEI